MIDITDKIQKDTNEFPMDIFSTEIRDNFKHLSEKYSLPLGYLGTIAIFTISALSGNMYQTELNGKIRNILFALLVGNSGLGKTKAYDLLCGDVIGSMAKDLKERFDREHQEWENKKISAKNQKLEFTESEPRRKIRMITKGTLEGIMKHAEHTSAGFGIYYAEGKDMLGSVNAYKANSGSGSIDFWNVMWDGGQYEDVRADNTRERSVYNTSISVLAGMQLDRMAGYFNQEAIESGLSSRFLITTSDIITLNEDIDHFSIKAQACDEWKSIVIRLFERGALDYFKDDTPFIIRFTGKAKNAYNDLSRQLIRESNVNRLNHKKGDVSALMIPYDSKLYQYAGRFLFPISIIDSLNDPVIDLIHVERAEKLYRYFRKEAEMVFTRINDELMTNLSETERQFFEALPEQFIKPEAKKIACKMRLSDKFFDTAFRRKYSKGFIRNLGDGKYEKM